MKYSIFIFWLWISGCMSDGAVVSNIENSSLHLDSLSKYSYLMLGIKPKTNGIGTYYQLATCFFVRHKGELIMITAKHSISGFSSSTLKPMPRQFDTLAIAYSKDGKQEYATMIVSSIKPAFLNKYFYESADMAIIHFSDINLKKYVYSLEDYIFEEKRNDEAIDSIFSYGYKPKDTYSVGSIITPDYYEGVMAESKQIDPYYPNNELLYSISTPVSIQGMSGSPIFIKYKSNVNKNRRILFGGVLFGGSDKYNATYYVPANTVRDSLNKFINGSQKQDGHQR